jgi:hypothetical protein
MLYLGEYGGRVLRAFKGDKPYIVGAEITPEEAEKWPIANRKALFNTHKVEWFGPPAGQPVQKPAPAKKATTPAKDKTTDTPSASTSGRRTMAFPNIKTGLTIRERGRAAFAALFLAGRQLASVIGFSIAQGGSSNITLVSIQMEDKNGNPVPGVQCIDIWLSDAATGIGITGTTASGAVAAGASGTDLGVLTTKKVTRVLTDANGKYILSITDTAKTLFYVAASLPANGSVYVSRQLVVGDYK